MSFDLADGTDGPATVAHGRLPQNATASTVILDFLHRLPDWLVYLAVIPSITGVAVLMPFVGRHALRVRPSADRAQGALEAYKAIVASLAFLLAFTLVQAQGTLRSLERVATQEAAALNTIDRSLLRYDAQTFTTLRGSLHELTRLLVSDEWPNLSEGRRSARAEALVDGLSRRLRTTEAGTSRQQSLLTELIGKLDEFTDRREELISEASTHLPALFWNTVLLLLAVLILLALFITPTGERVLTVGGITAASSLVLCLLIITDAPFSGGATVSPAPLERALGLMLARQADPPGP